jgi:RNA polymerase sigma-70 factor (ECF subfamily)
MEEPNESILLQQLANNSQAAFSQIYQLHWKGMFLTASRVLRSQEEASDLVHDVFLTLWNRRNDINIVGSLSAYLHTSVRYKAISLIQRNLNRSNYLTLLNETAVHHLNDDPDSLMHLKQLREVVNNVVIGMPPKMQMAYRLSREKHFSHKQIGEQMGISPETVKKHIQNALEIIRIAIADHGLSISAVVLLAVS